MKVELLQLKKNEDLFVAGTNLGTKVQVGIKGVESMEFDGKFVLVKCKGITTYVRDFFSITPDKQAQIQQTHHAMTSDIAKAQVSTPYSGQAQVETPISKEPRKPGRPPKFQGQEQQ